LQRAFHSLVADNVDGKPVQNGIASQGDIPAQTPLSLAISKALKARGFRFVGPTTVYAMMQAVDMVNDHLITCIAMRHVAACGPKSNECVWPNRGFSVRFRFRALIEQSPRASTALFGPAWNIAFAVLKIATPPNVRRGPPGAVQ
jgi:hypothetical protein